MTMTAPTRTRARTISPDASINSLVVACWNDAERRAREGDTAARRWLYGEGTLWLDIVLNLHPDHTRRYLRRKLTRRAPKRRITHD